MILRLVRGGSLGIAVTGVLLAVFGLLARRMEFFKLGMTVAACAGTAYEAAPKWFEGSPIEWGATGRRLLAMCAVIGLAVPIGLLTLAWNEGRPFLGDEALLVLAGIPFAAITGVQAALRSRSRIVRGDSTAWDRAVVITAPLALLCLAAVFVAYAELDSLSSQRPWLAVLVAFVLVFNAMYAMLRSERRSRIPSTFARRTHA